MMNYFRKTFAWIVDDDKPMTRDKVPLDNGPECLKTPTKDARNSVPATPSERFPLGYWSNNRKKKNMDSRSPFRGGRGGGGMQVHAVPEGERATVNGQQLPWAYEYAE
jgi:hypothetical protein